MLFLGLGAALAASALFNVGIVLQALDAREAPAEQGLRLSLLGRLVRRRRWVAGLLLGGVGFGLQVLALAHAPFVLVQPALAAGLLLLLFLGVRMLHERVGMTEILGVAGIAGGVALLTWGSPTQTEGLRSDTAAIAVMGALGALALAPFVLRRTRWDSALFIVIASALGYGAGNIATKLLSDDVGGGHWSIAAVWLAVAIGTGIVALLTEMTALQRRPAMLVIPLSFAVQTFLPVVLEPIYLIERWGTAALDGVPLICGLVLIAVGAVAVSRTRAVSLLASGGVPA